MKIYILTWNAYTGYDAYDVETKFVTIDKQKMLEYVNNLHGLYFGNMRDFLNIEIWENEKNIFDVMVRTKEKAVTILNQ